MANLPSLGSKAPDFKANTTSGPIKLSDYIGKWVVLFSHPGDFTPVCTTEFLCFTKYYDEFNKKEFLERNNLYKDLCKEIWSIERLDEICR